MKPEDSPAAQRRLVLVSTAGLVLLLLVLAAAWLVSRRMPTGDFVLGLKPTAPGARTYQLSLRDPSGAVLGLWGFQDVPGPSILEALQKKVPWKALSTQANPGQPCLTLEAPTSVPEAVLTPIERLALEQCCPGCPVRRVVR